MSFRNIFLPQLDAKYRTAIISSINKLMPILSPTEISIFDYQTT